MKLKCKKPAGISEIKASWQL